MRQPARSCGRVHRQDADGGAGPTGSGRCRASAARRCRRARQRRPARNRPPARASIRWGVPFFSFRIRGGSPDDRFSAMDSATAARLSEINRDFYRQVAAEFSRSRSRLNPGILRSFRSVRPGSLLDAGCGDGRVGLAWAAGQLDAPFDSGASYVGLDQSADLLVARQPWPQGLRPLQGDLLDSDAWPADRFAMVCCFATLHHIPDRQARVGLLREIAGHLQPGGPGRPGESCEPGESSSHWVVSVWQIMHLERFRQRIVSWEEAGVDPDSVGAGDLLLDWRRGERALRYVHQYELDELRADCAEAGLVVSEDWRSDGEGGDLGLYVSGEGPKHGDTC
ncbi:hypothetical protein DRQ32_11830 [bacterium]|nr:MAG: hypothetical protein DRQ32_11830 [bacterium]